MIYKPVKNNKIEKIKVAIPKPSYMRKSLTLAPIFPKILLV